MKWGTFVWNALLVAVGFSYLLYDKGHRPNAEGLARLSSDLKFWDDSPVTNSSLLVLLVLLAWVIGLSAGAVVSAIDRLIEAMKYRL